MSKEIVEVVEVVPRRTQRVIDAVAEAESAVWQARNALMITNSEFVAHREDYETFSRQLHDVQQMLRGVCERLVTLRDQGGSR